MKISVNLIKNIIVALQPLAPGRGVALFVTAVLLALAGTVSSGWAAISSQQVWTNVYHSATLPGGTVANVAVNAGTSRMLVVAIACDFNGSSAITGPTSVTYGGTNMIFVVGDAASASRPHTFLYYLKDVPAVMDGTAKALVVTGMAAGTGSSLIHDIYYAVYAGVDQTASPLETPQSTNSLSANVTSAAFPAALTVNAGEQAVAIYNAFNNGGIAVPTITLNANFTAVATQTNTATAGVRTTVATRTIPGTATTDTASATYSPSVRLSVVGISMKPAVASNPANATNSTVTALPASVLADGIAASTITVTLKDAGSNAVPGKTVTLASSRGATDTISAASGVSSALGVVTFTVTSTTPGSPVFTATATNDSVVVAQTAAVTFTASSAGDILTFGTNIVGSSAIIDTNTAAVAWTVPNGSVVASLAPVYTVSPMASGAPASGASRDFTAPQTYTVTAQDLSTKVYTVTVTVAPPSTNRDILTFSFPTYGAAAIVGTNISLTVPYGTVVTSLAPTYTVSPLAAGAPASGTSRDFTAPQTYTVTAQDLSTKVYTMTVTVAAPSTNKDILTFTFPTFGAATIVGTNISLTVPAGTPVTSLAPAYTVSPLAAGAPVSGTGRNFTAPQTYTVTAQDFSTKAYLVTVTVAAGPQTYGLTMGTDLAQDFSPLNGSGHPIVTNLNNYVNSTSPKALTAASLLAPWSANPGTQTMLCSDCHDAQTTNYVATAAQGPHGSAYQYMLRGPNASSWPTNSLANFATSWCANCHVYGGAGRPHTQGEHSSRRCYECHIVIPHGGKLARLIADRDGKMPARYAYQNNTNNVIVTGFTKTNTANYATSHCGTSACTGDHRSTNGASW